MERLRVRTVYKWWRNALAASLAAFLAGWGVYAALSGGADGGGGAGGAAATLWAGLRAYWGWFVAAHAALAAALVLVDGRHGERTLAWLFVLALVPVLGLAAYWVLGPDLRQAQRRLRFRRRRRAPPNTFGADARDADEVAVETLWRRMDVGDAEPCRAVAAFFDGAELFARMCADLAAARRTACAEFYIFRDDETGGRVVDALAAAAANGARARLIVDAAGSHRLGRAFYARLAARGVEARRFHPVALPYLRGFNFRNHRKIVTVDDAIGYVGGFNVGDEYVGRHPRLGAWYDAHLRLEGGGAVRALSEVFLGDWAICGPPADGAPDGGKPADAAGMADGPDSDAAPRGDGDAAHRADADAVRIVASGPDAPWDAIHRGYFGLVVSARERVWVTTPYLVPGAALMTALTTAALSGVDVRVVIPGQPDSRLAHWCTLGHVEPLLRAGVKVYRYAPGRFVHAKTAVVDGVWASVGTANWDARSMEINFEVQAFVTSRPLAAVLEARFVESLADSECLSAERWERRGVRARLLEGVGRLIAPLA